MSARIRFTKPSQNMVPAVGEIVPVSERMGYMQVLRFGIALAVCLSTLLATEIVGVPRRLITIAALYLFFVVSTEGLRRALKNRWTGAGMMLLVDGLYLGWVMYATGGSNSPLRFLVYVHLICVTLLISYKTGLKIAMWHTLVFFTMFYLQAVGILSPVESAITSISGLPFERLSVFNVLAFWVIALGTTAASSINERELRKRKVDLEALTEMADQMERVSEPSEIASNLLAKLREISAFNHAAVLGGSNADLSLLAYVGPAGQSATYAGRDPLITQVWESREPRLLKRLDRSENPGLAALFPSCNNLMIVPLYAEGREMGAVLLQYPDNQRLGVEKRTLDMIVQFASHAALAIGNAWLMQRVQAMADTDHLTGVANRRIFESTLERELARATRNGDQVTLVMVDVDHFKTFNDTYGHHSGDKVLQGVARSLVEASREFDTVARYGGEEFAVVIPSCTFKDSLVSGERLRQVISTVRAESDITASAGTATFPTNATDALSLLKAADEALYEAKRSGRNRVVRSRRKPSKVQSSASDLESASAIEPAPAMSFAPREDARLSYLMENSSEVILCVTPEGVVRYQSPSVIRLLGYQPGELVGSKFGRLVHPTESARADSLGVLAEKGALSDVPAEWSLKRKDGSFMLVEAVTRNMLADATIGGLVFVARDISDRKRLEIKLEQQALVDPMTRLANRTLFLSHVEHAIERGKHRRKGLAMLVMDLDDFKTINELMGNAIGDGLLTMVAARIRDCLSPSDIAARLSGDEFAVLLEGVNSPRHVRQAATKIMDAMKAPFAVGGRTLYLQMSIGAVFCGPSDSAEDMLRKADVAMNAAKAGGKGDIEVYEPGKHAGVVKRMELKAHLQEAISERQFVLHYQPLVNLASGRIVGFESLIRWDHPERGLISPAEFIPLAEESGAILPIGRMVLEQACQQAKEWEKTYPEAQPFFMSVNLSVKQIQDPALIGDVAWALASAELDPNNLVLEVTESILMQDVEKSIACLRGLKELGVQIAIDDFGTGYSSLMYLRRLPIDILKIAKPFIDGIATSEEGSAFTGKIVELAALMDMRTVAEGIEEPEQMLELRRLSCDLGQGYYFARGLEPGAAGDLLKDAASGSASFEPSTVERV